ncbi:MAG: hypothetical protein ACREQ2_17100 [Candidatus Binatia bacterium]
METDDGVRSLVGVIACLRTAGNGIMHLVFDDAKSDTANKPTSWKPEALFTWNQYDSEKLRGMKLTEKEYAEIGENLVMRLLALSGEVQE